MTITAVLESVLSGVREECRDPGVFLGICAMMIAKQDFVQNYDRLRGTSLLKLAGRSPINRLIDEATGHDEAQLTLFVADIYDLFWLRMPPECFPQCV